MARDGENRDKLSLRDWICVYLHGDGFGPITEEFANKHCYDWSHVRDSTPFGFQAMAKILMSILYKQVAQVSKILNESDFDEISMATVRFAEWIIISDERGMNFLLPAGR